MLITGGTDGKLIQSLDVLHNINNLCSLATTASQCYSLSCFACGNASDSSFTGCFADNICTELGGVQLLQSLPSSVECSLFSSCKECLIGDVSRTLNCTWCLCDNSTSCTLPSECPCRPAESPRRCVLEECKYPECRGCQSGDDCVWLGASVRSDPLIHDSLTVSHSFEEWGCFSSFITKKIIKAVGDFSLEACPTACSRLTNCNSCVSSRNSHGGSLTCVWSSYSNECMSEDSVPLLCATSTCGTIVSSSEQCTRPCSHRQTCTECHSSPECAWKPGDTVPGACFSVAEVEGLSIGKVVNCVDCPASCTDHGRCAYTGQCVCDLGYVGQACSVSCSCNGFSNCANETDVGRSTCLECLNNTQVNMHDSEKDMLTKSLARS